MKELDDIIKKLKEIVELYEKLQEIQKDIPCVPYEPYPIVWRYRYESDSGTTTTKK